MGLQHVCGATEFEPFPEAALEHSLVDRFEHEVARHARCLAVVDGDIRLTYEELDAWANGVAHAVADRVGLRREPVAIVVEQGAGYAASVLGVLKSGRPYVPLDPADPFGRLGDFAATSGAVAVVADNRTAARAADACGDIELIRVDAASPRSTAPGVALDGDALAYIFFTSGSTGEPKGVYDNHRNVLHNVLRYTNALEIALDDRLTLLQGPAFSGCISSQFGALLNGAASFPFRLREEGLVRAADWLRRERITIYHSVPSIFRALVSRGGSFPDIRVVRLEGDRSTEEDVRLWERHLGPRSVLANGLGTTETGLARQLIVRRPTDNPDGALPIGYPVTGVDVFVVDDARRPVLDGDIGEIAVASEYLALGYWNRPDLTAERFVSHNGARVYLTGDLGRMDANGCLEYLGRREGDLKLHGMRVEPAEIERELLRLGPVRDAAVAVHEGARGASRLVAYVVPHDVGIELADLRQALAARLPTRLLPTALVELDALPLGANGKVDRRALPVPDPTRELRDLPAQTDRWLAQIWCEVLEVDAVGPDDDFFELGGDSLAAAEILARVEDETGRSLPLATFVGAPTVGLLADRLRGMAGPASASVTVLRHGDESIPPLLLVHGASGNTFKYSRLVKAIDNEQPLWALEYTDPSASREVDAIVEAHLAEIARLRPSGPYLVVGSCYAGVIGHELATRLAHAGHDVHLAVLGVTPFDFPSVVPSAPYERWARSYGPEPGLVARTRYHLRAARHLRGRERFSYVYRRVRSLARRRAQSLRSSVDRTPPVWVVAQQALASHVPSSFPGRPLLVLQENDTALYTDEPAQDWASLGTMGVDVVVLPGGINAMLEEPGVAELAHVLRAWTGAVAAGTP